MKTYKNTEYPKRATDLSGNEENFSVDVVTYHDALLNIGFYNFDTKKWGFHTDTLTDMYEDGELQEFIWMYNPFTN
ncbi:MAG: hypothetical protein WC026_13070 [Hyphomicrobium sp.]|uniref:hypothetical protein n=1 Tax=Hyphomicrobium sp. TaxID=82 RepID=UPI00356B558A